MSTNQPGGNAGDHTISTDQLLAIIGDIDIPEDTRNRAAEVDSGINWMDEMAAQAVVNQPFYGESSRSNQDQFAGISHQPYGMTSQSSGTINQTPGGNKQSKAYESIDSSDTSDSHTSQREDNDEDIDWDALGREVENELVGNIGDQPSGQLFSSTGGQPSGGNETHSRKHVKEKYRERSWGRNPDRKGNIKKFRPEGKHPSYYYHLKHIKDTTKKPGTVAKLKFSDPFVTNQLKLAKKKGLDGFTTPYEFSKQLYNEIEPELSQLPNENETNVDELRWALVSIEDLHNFMYEGVREGNRHVAILCYLIQIPRAVVYYQLHRLDQEFCKYRNQLYHAIYGQYTGEPDIEIPQRDWFIPDDVSGYEPPTPKVPPKERPFWYYDGMEQVKDISTKPRSLKEYIQGDQLIQQQIPSLMRQQKSYTPGLRFTIEIYDGREPPIDRPSDDETNLDVLHRGLIYIYQLHQFIHDGMKRVDQPTKNPPLPQYVQYLRLILRAVVYHQLNRLDILFCEFRNRLREVVDPNSDEIITAEPIESYIPSQVEGYLSPRTRYPFMYQSSGSTQTEVVPTTTTTTITRVPNPLKYARTHTETMDAIGWKPFDDTENRGKKGGRSGKGGGGSQPKKPRTGRPKPETTAEMEKRLLEEMGYPQDDNVDDSDQSSASDAEILSYFQNQSQQNTNQRSSSAGGRTSITSNSSDTSGSHTSQREDSDEGIDWDAMARKLENEVVATTDDQQSGYLSPNTGGQRSGGNYEPPDYEDDNDVWF